ncbi:hypothetical protein ACFSTA_17490 [Ornithinibacillus salinisoli]|uniref:Uncharacterized protein n=1 Tax=Ornithinibacillus salinisoli TaxID=1848459 RepID=A0ABW4W591_9BACI
MNDRNWSANSSEQANDHLEVKAWKIEFSHPDEREVYMERLRVGSEFDMRYRGIFEFYGADLVAYKLKHKSSNQVNDFLRVFSKYLTDYLEDDCPPSWEECSHSFCE